VRDTVVIPFFVRRLDVRNAVFSDIELCSSIQKITPDSTNLFYKNTLEVVPNPMLVYGKSLPTVPYYAELYNAPSDRFILKTEIVSYYGRTIASKTQQRNGNLPSRWRWGCFNRKS